MHFVQIGLQEAGLRTHTTVIGRKIIGPAGIRTRDLQTLEQMHYHRATGPLWTHTRYSCLLGPLSVCYNCNIVFWNVSVCNDRLWKSVIVTKRRLFWKRAENTQVIYRYTDSRIEHKAFNQLRKRKTTWNYCTILLAKSKTILIRDSDYENWVHEYCFDHSSNHFS